MNPFNVGDWVLVSELYRECADGRARVKKVIGDKVEIYAPGIRTQYLRPYHFSELKPAPSPKRRIK
jgi:hypothetical protein